MFGRKSREIKELKSFLKDNDSIMVARLEGLKKAALEIDGWQRRFSDLQAENHKAQTQVIPALVAERDALREECEQLRKSHENIRTERLETEAQRFRTSHPEVKAPSDAPFES